MLKFFQRTFGFSKYNVIGIILLLPFLTMFSIDFISRLAQHNFTSPNPAAIAALSQTFLYSTPVLVTWVVLFPLLAILLNILPLLKKIKEIGRTRQTVSTLEFFNQHSISFLIVCMGAIFLGAIILHDFAPCVLTGIMTKSLDKIVPLVQYCTTA